jgi:hypothetical protein
VQGFFNQPRIEQGRKHLQAITREKGAHSSRGTFLKEPIAKLERSLQSVQVPLYYLPCCIYLLEELHIYTYISNWFSPGGFCPGSC